MASKKVRKRRREGKSQAIYNTVTSSRRGHLIHFTNNSLFLISFFSTVPLDFDFFKHI